MKVERVSDPRNRNIKNLKTLALALLTVTILAITFHYTKEWKTSHSTQEKAFRAFLSNKGYKVLSGSLKCGDCQGEEKWKATCSAETDKGHIEVACECQWDGSGLPCWQPSPKED